MVRLLKRYTAQTYFLLSQKRIKTVIGGASIIDMMILVIDINKGIQAQTAEVIICPSHRSPPTPVRPNMIFTQTSVSGYRRNYRYSYYFRAEQNRQSRRKCQGKENQSNEKTYRR